MTSCEDIKFFYIFPRNFSYCILMCSIVEKKHEAGLCAYDG